MKRLSKSAGTGRLAPVVSVLSGWYVICVGEVPCLSVVSNAVNRARVQLYVFVSVSSACGRKSV